MAPAGVQGISARPNSPVEARPTLIGLKPSTSLCGAMASSTRPERIALGNGSCTRMPWIAGSALSFPTSDEQFRLTGRFRQIILQRVKPALLGRLALGADINLARRVGPDQHDREAGGHGKRARLVGDACERDLRDGFAVEDERAQGEGIRFQARLLCARFITLGNRLVASAGAVPGPRRRSLRLERLQRRRRRPPTFFASFSKSRPVFSKLFQRFLWRFCGISMGYNRMQTKKSSSKFFVFSLGSKGAGRAPPNSVSIVEGT